MRHKFAAYLVLMASAAGTFIAHPARAQGQAPPAHQHDQQEKASERAPDSQKRPTEPQHDMSHMAGMHHGSDSQSGMDAAGMFLMNESSGTGIQPSAWPMPMLMTRAGSWQLMWMAQDFLVETQQSGARGGDKFYSSNWGMVGATHKLGGGSLMLRSMLSLEPATITNRRYPLLFQTGETAYGQSLVDGQHPHDFVMEPGD